MNTLQIRMLQLTLIFVSALFNVSTHAQVYVVETVPNVKLIDNSYVSDPDHILNSAVVSKINQALGDLEKETTVQVAVVVLNSIGDADVFDFAQRLFNTWGIGHSRKDNGLLVLMVLDKHTIRFHTGYGVEGVLPDIICKHIQMQQMIPHFKNNDYNNGMIAGIEEVVRILKDPIYANELLDESRKEDSGWSTFFWVALIVGIIIILIWYSFMNMLSMFEGTKPESNDKYIALRPNRWLWLLIYGVIPIGFLLIFNFRPLVNSFHILTFLLIIYGYLSFSTLWKLTRMYQLLKPMLLKKDYAQATDFLSDYSWYWITMAAVFPIPNLFIWIHYKRRKYSFRNGPRKCKSCGSALERLDETQDNKYLTKQQDLEEKLHSVDYDVWLCKSCGKQEVERYPGKDSKYTECPGCKTVSLYTKSSRTISSATYSSTGTEEETKRCKFCNHSSVEVYTIPMLVESTSSSSSSDSNSSSSNDDSGSSWGGGSSGGGGASSSW